jgi:hypothetical protein
MLIVTGDTNDADYITKTTYVDESELQNIKAIIQKVSEFKPYVGTRKDWTHPHDNNFPYGDGEYIPRADLGEKSAQEMYGDMEGFDYFTEECCPFNIHDLTHIELVEVSNSTILLNK